MKLWTLVFGFWTQVFRLRVQCTKASAAKRSEPLKSCIYIYIPLKHKIICIDGFAPPGSPVEVRPEYSFFLIRKNRYLVTLARVSPRRNNRSRAQTPIFAIENLMSSSRARRQEARKCRPEEFSARMKSFNSHCFFSISALLH